MLTWTVLFNSITMSYSRYFSPFLPVRSLRLKVFRMHRNGKYWRILEYYLPWSIHCTLHSYIKFLCCASILCVKESIKNIHIHIKTVKTFPRPLRELMGDGKFVSKPLHWSSWVLPPGLTLAEGDGGLQLPHWLCCC